MGTSRTVITPCKVNLHLGIHAEKDERGYHRVDSVMVPVALCDEVVVEDAAALSVTHEPALEVAPRQTTVWRAATLLGEALGREPRVAVRVRARIPERAGLGGSSADAAAVLRALADRWGLGPEDPRVLFVARRVGADVSFFLDPAPSLWLGAGDVREEAYPALELPLALVMPAAGGVSTKECYDEYDRAATEPAGYGEMCAALAAGDAGAVGGLLFNNLAPAAKRLSPEVGEVERWLLGQPGVISGQVTGSGACSFAICRSVGAAEGVARAAREERGWRSWATTTVGAWGQVC